MFRALWLRTSGLKVRQREGWRAASVNIRLRSSLMALFTAFGTWRFRILGVVVRVQGPWRFRLTPPVFSAPASDSIWVLVRKT